jgi:1,2-phenylacetyl-CoA epoxidase catalytic subunit
VRLGNLASCPVEEDADNQDSKLSIISNAANFLYTHTYRETYLVGSVALLNQGLVCHYSELECVYQVQVSMEEFFHSHGFDRLINLCDQPS